MPERCLTRCAPGEPACVEVTARLAAAELVSKAMHPAAGDELRRKAQLHAHASGLAPMPERRNA